AIYTLALHDALPILVDLRGVVAGVQRPDAGRVYGQGVVALRAEREAPQSAGVCGDAGQVQPCNGERGPDARLGAPDQVLVVEGRLRLGHHDPVFLEEIG